jgi:hypothetical protein
MNGGTGIAEITDFRDRFDLRLGFDGPGQGL